MTETTNKSWLQRPWGVHQ